jgi:rhamnogalacturonyl hydrolase YesR
MKVFAAALIAIGVLYAIDAQYNDGRYSTIIQQAITSLLPR